MGDTANTSFQMQRLYGGHYYSNYEELKNTIVVESNILETPTWTRDIAQMKFLCDSEPLCVGFTSDGYLKSSVDPISRRKDRIGARSLFVKNRVVNTLIEDKRQKS